VEIFEFCWASSHHRLLIEVKFRTAKRTYVPLIRAKCHVNRCK